LKFVFLLIYYLQTLIAVSVHKQEVNMKFVDQNNSAEEQN